ncbi:MAG: hypothetical protein VX712_01595, partial [Bacteroidota bacterium]|nr:hypothetical protein [Bacteroidota bacterium]
MKNIMIKNSWIYGFLFLSLLLLGSCSSDDSTGSGPISVDAVYLQDVNSSVPDRQVEFARLGQLIRLEGSGFEGLRRVYINGFQT